MMESKEREIKHLNDKVRAMEREYDDLIQKESRERIKADKPERSTGGRRRPFVGPSTTAPHGGT